MKLAKCPHCGAGLDISAVPPGSAVACGGCGKPFWLAPGVIAAPPAPPAGARAPGPPPPHRLRSAPAGTRNPLPLLLGFAAAVAAVVFVLSWVLFAGKEKAAAPPPKPAGPASTAAPGASPGAPPVASPAAPGKPRTPLELRAETAGLDVPKYLEMLVARAAESPESAKAAWEELKGLGLDDRAALALAEGRKAFPHDPWLNEKLGLKDRTADIQKAAGDAGMQDRLGDFPDYQRVVDLSEAVRAKSGSGWLDDAASSRLDGWLKSCGERLAWLQDPVNERTERMVSNLRYDPQFSKLSFGAIVFRPYTVFVEDAEPERREAVRGAAERAGKALLGGYRNFYDFLVRDLGLGDAQRLEDAKDTRLRVFVFRDRKSLGAWQAEAKETSPMKGGLGCFSTVHQMILVHAEGDPAAPTAVAGLDPDAGVLLHIGFHQLFDWYQRSYCGLAGKAVPEGYGSLSPTRNTPDTLFWFQEGSADYFSAARPAAGRDGEWEPGQPDGIHLDRIALARSRHQEWKAGDLLFADYGELLDRAERKDWGKRGSEEVRSLIHAHGWSLVHYFMKGDGGKWRPRFLQYARREIRGEHLRAKVDDLAKDLPGLAEVLKGDPDLADEIRGRKDLVVALSLLLQRTPELARRLRTRDLLDAFGLPKETSDPKVAAWIGEVDAGWRRHVDALLAARAKGK